MFDVIIQIMSKGNNKFDHENLAKINTQILKNIYRPDYAVVSNDNNTPYEEFIINLRINVIE